MSLVAPHVNAVADDAAEILAAGRIVTGAEVIGLAQEIVRLQLQLNELSDDA